MLLAASDDMRARRCTGRIHDDCDEQLKAQLIQDKAPVHRDVFECAEACCVVLDSVDDTGFADSETEDDDDDDDDDDEEKESGIASDDSEDEGSVRIPCKRRSKSTQQSRKRKKRKRACPVNLHIEVTADKPDEAKIWQQYVHKDAPERALTWSLQLKRVGHEDARSFGGTAARVKLSKVLPQIMQLLIIKLSHRTPIYLSKRRLEHSKVSTAKIQAHRQHLP